MANVVHKAVSDKRNELSARITLLKAQLQPVKDEAQNRKNEIDAVQADIAELDAWLLANP